MLGVPSEVAQSLPFFRNLEFLEISNCKTYFMEFFLNLENCKNLTHLDFQISTKQYGRFTSSELRKFPEISVNWPKLEHLNLQNHGSSFDQETLVGVFCELIEKQPSLKYLNISSEDMLSDYTNIVLKSMFKNSTISCLDISSCEIDEIGMELVECLQKTKQITIITKNSVKNEANDEQS